MPFLSDSSKNIPSSPIRKLVPFSDAAKSKGIKVYHLNIGQPDIKTPKQVIDRIKNLEREIIEYSPSRGMTSYRKGLVHYYKQFQIRLKEEEIMVTTGCSEAIPFAIQSCFNPGDELIIPEPFYANYNCFSSASGVRIVPLTSKIEDGFALPAISEIEKKITDKTKGIFICNPNNPTGYVYSKSELEQLGEIVLKHDLFLLADEVYKEFNYSSTPFYSILNLKGLEQHVVVIDSISKRYSMCGARVGSLVTRNKEVMDAVFKYADARLCPPTLGQIAAEAALDTPASYFENVLAEYVKRRDIVVDRINEIDGAYCTSPQGAFYVIARLPIDDSDKFCRWLLEEFEQDKETLMLAPATGFYASPDLGKDEVRIAYVLNRVDLEKAMNCLKIALEIYESKN